MARQCGDMLITGAIDNLCFYKMEDKYYVRAKSSLKGKRVRADAAFKNTMRFANMLANASKIAAAVYKKQGDEQRAKGLYRKMTGEVMQLLKNGLTNEQALLQLELIYLKQEKDKGDKSTLKNISQWIAVDVIIEAIFSEYFEKPVSIPEFPP